MIIVVDVDKLVARLCATSDLPRGLRSELFACSTGALLAWRAVSAFGRASLGKSLEPLWSYAIITLGSI